MAMMVLVWARLRRVERLLVALTAWVQDARHGIGPAAPTSFDSASVEILPALTRNAVAAKAGGDRREFAWLVPQRADTAAIPDTMDGPDAAVGLRPALATTMMAETRPAPLAVADLVRWQIFFEPPSTLKRTFLLFRLVNYYDERHSLRKMQDQKREIIVERPGAGQVADRLIDRLRAGGPGCRRGGKEGAKLVEAEGGAIWRDDFEHAVAEDVQAGAGWDDQRSFRPCAAGQHADRRRFHPQRLGLVCHHEIGGVMAGGTEAQRAIAACVDGAKAVLAKGGKVVLLSPQPAVPQVIQFAGIDELIPIHMDEAAAIAAVSS